MAGKAPGRGSSPEGSGRTACRSGRTDQSRKCWRLACRIWHRQRNHRPRLFPAADRQAVRLDQHADRPCLGDPFRRGRFGHDLVRERSDRLLERRSHTAVTFLITAIGLILMAVTPNPVFPAAGAVHRRVRRFSQCCRSFGRCQPPSSAAQRQRREWPISTPSPISPASSALY